MFYNAAMAADRDISVAVAAAMAARAGARTLCAWEMLSATGVRGLRILNESRLFASLLSTERHPEAFSVLSANADRYASLGARALLHDARELPPEVPFEWIDLDPFGSPIPYRTSLFGAAAPQSVLAVTATDLRVLAGAERGACERRYGAVPLRGRLGPEGGLRILLGWLSEGARGIGQRIEPLLSYVGDHHLRTYLRLVKGGDGEPPVGPIDPREFEGPRLPGRGPYGPLWLGPLMEPDLVLALKVPELPARPREVSGLLERFRGEASLAAPFFYEPNELARGLALSEPPPLEALLAGLRDIGWAAARTHARPGAFRTAAPRVDVERVAREAAARRVAQSQKARVRA